MRGFFLALCFLLASPAMAAPHLQPIDKVWSGHSVKFALLVTRTRVVIGYYDAGRQLTVAMRDRTGGSWISQKLDTSVGWDSHNYVALAEDGEGRIHLAANMHVSPLTYWMSEPGGDVRTLKRVSQLVDDRSEKSMTYPIFLHDHANRLILKYRDGGSGNGNEIYDVFDDRTATWAHLTTAPLTDGEGLRNGYFMGPVIGPDQRFHIAWVWRETPDAATSHDLSYARSPDLIHWSRADGTPLALPITLATAEIVDPVPVKGGMINNNTIIGFDDKGRVMITYHKYDKAGDTQIFVARFEGKRWHTHRISRWKAYRWDFGGNGSLNSEIVVAGAQPIGKGLLKVPVVRLGKSTDFIIRSRDLSLVEARPVLSLADRLKPEMTIPDGMMLNIEEDPSGYALAWATLPPHRDQAVADIPSSTTLMLVAPSSH